MQTPEELVRKIKLEEHELNTSLDKLEYFMMTEDFTKISKEQKTLLEQQHKVMTEYKLILIKRAHRINREAGRDKAAAEIKEATELKDPDAEPAERKTGAMEPEPHHCLNCKHHETKEYADGQIMHICNSELLCSNKIYWEEQDGTPSDK